MNRLKPIITFLIFCSVNISLVNAQESLVGLENNISVSGSIVNLKKQKNIDDTLALPFIDDFSRNIGFPDSSLWIDKNSFVNQSYSINPITIGVASLDGIDDAGNLYDDYGDDIFQADLLTSKAIDLNYSGDNTIFLSFYYQPGGLGDTPEPNDSLLLDFYSPNTEKWTTVWFSRYNESDSILTEEYAYNSNILTRKADTITNLYEKFSRVILPVNDENYLQKGFKFRFRNYVSLSNNSEVPSVIGNADHWNLDFIILDKNRNINDTIINDIAFIKPLTSLLINYESIPWSHFPRANAYEMNDSIVIEYKNIGQEVWNVLREFEIEDITGDGGIYTFTGGVGDDIPPFTSEMYYRNMNYIFPYNSEIDSALFEIRSYMVTDTFIARAPYRWNDTIKYLQKFYNYYAYDDGTAENGYGLLGDGTKYGQVACQFETYKEDTLQAIQFYFNKTRNNANQQYFNLMIWDDNNGKPGNLLYSQTGVKPIYEDSLNKFSIFNLDNKLILDGKFFVGWQKTTTDMLNIGFDVNRISTDKLFHNINGSWENSEFEGALMIRPVFGKPCNINTGINNENNRVDKKFDFKIYPNPAKEIINISIDDSWIDNYSCMIFDSYGRIVYSVAQCKRRVNLSEYASGVYFLRLTSKNGVNATKKFIIIH
ncbi:MAG: T9SS type A sorting domain-containing protein [Bacteroidales bacterium]|jgi:hypothetical protein|nr:T9SS type A sorting domain-containing protein [Bacteroidales bacterium]